MVNKRIAIQLFALDEVVSSNFVCIGCIGCINELINIKQIKNYERKDINKNNLYHPEKELNIHIYYRTHLIPHLIIQ
jgi:predicted Fe-S protein YdhL (DUF1289 family)